MLKREEFCLPLFFKGGAFVAGLILATGAGGGWALSLVVPGVFFFWKKAAAMSD